jgi:hypothetical protein
MDKITVLTHESSDARSSNYCAISGEAFAIGETFGGAIDGLAAKVGPAKGTTLVVLQTMQADEYFTETQQQRLAALMSRWKSSEKEGLSAEEREELHGLVQAELVAATRRSAALFEKSKR